MKVRIKFAKTGVLKFVGHLDLLRLFQKAFRRAKLPMSYSQGFNPHQLISIGAPLPLGVTSEGEYMDIQITTPLPKEEAIKRLNETLPEGVSVIDWIVLDDSAKSAMAIIQGATYTLTVDHWPLSEDETQKALNQFLNQEKINVIKTSKKKTKEIDIKPGIIKMTYDAPNFEVMLATGSQLNIKPEWVIKAFTEHARIAEHTYQLGIHRNELYTHTKDEWLALDQL